MRERAKDREERGEGGGERKEEEKGGRGRPGERKGEEEGERGRDEREGKRREGGREGERELGMAQSFLLTKTALPPSDILLPASAYP